MLFGENLERKRGKNTPLERTLERTAGRKNPLETQEIDTTWLCRWPNIFIWGVAMDKQTIDYLKSTYPDVITKDQFYRICHISKKTASYLLDNELVPCTNSGKQTRKYKILLDDVIAFLDARENNPFAFKAPDNYYGHGAYNPHALNIERTEKCSALSWITR